MLTTVNENISQRLFNLPLEDSPTTEYRSWTGVGIIIEEMKKLGYDVIFCVNQDDYKCYVHTSHETFSGFGNNLWDAVFESVLKALDSKERKRALALGEGETLQ